MTDWKKVPTHIVAGMNELYQQMLPTKIYHNSRTRLEMGQNVLCWMCGKASETQTHVLTGCSTLTQSKYFIEQHHIMIDVLGGCSASVRKGIRELTGEKTKADETLSRMQTVILPNSLHIARSFKILPQ